MSMWMVRAEGGTLYDDFLAGGHVTIGGIISGDVAAARSRADVTRMWLDDQPALSERDAAGAGSVLYRFAHEIADRDSIVTYDPGARIYAVGTVRGPYRYDTTGIGRSSGVAIRIRMSDGSIGTAMFPRGARAFK